MTKLNKLYKYSNPEEVSRKAMQLQLNEIHPSSRANKSTWYSMDTTWYILGHIQIMKIILSIIMRKEGIILIKGIISGQMLLYILQRGFHIGYYGINYL